MLHRPVWIDSFHCLKLQMCWMRQLEACNPVQLQILLSTTKFNNTWVLLKIKIWHCYQLSLTFLFQEMSLWRYKPYMLLSSCCKWRVALDYNKECYHVNELDWSHSDSSKRCINMCKFWPFSWWPSMMCLKPFNI